MTTIMTREYLALLGTITGSGNIVNRDDKNTS